jgi:hypothetical protein
MPRRRTRKTVRRISYRPRKKVHQVGKSNTRRDLRYHAKRVGKRRSRAGRIYYEYRRNRTDVGKKVTRKRKGKRKRDVLGWL